jgi:ABC-2 type transport system permease protein
MSSVPVPVPGVDYSTLGEPVKGPSALGSDRKRLLRLTWTLAITDFRLRFFGSALGYLWQFMQPLMLFGVLYTVFSVLLDFGGPEKFYPVALLAGIVMFGYVAEATTGSVRAIVNRESLVRKIEFPRLAVPLSTVLTALMNYGLNLLPVFVFLLASGGEVRWSWLELPFLVAFLTVWLVGLSMLLSALFVRYRDIEPIWTVILQVLFYATPIFYTLSTVTEKTGKDWVGEIIMANPFAATLQQFRHAIVDPSHQSAADAIGGTGRLILPLAVTLITFAVGLVVFVRMAPKVAEEL